MFVKTLRLYNGYEKFILRPNKYKAITPVSRKYTQFAGDMEKALLDALADENSGVDSYRQSMYQLGECLGSSVLSQIVSDLGSAYLACTAEDADFLAKGILSRLEGTIAKVTLACFWNKRFKPFGISDLQVAPILKRYLEPSDAQVDSLIIVKSIISGACVVRTNLIDMITRVSPQQIFIIAPVIYKGAEERLRKGFSEDIYNKFRYIYLAEDDIKSPEGIIIPGIGGDVYERLGFGSQDDKNRSTPKLVKERRPAISQKPSLRSSDNDHYVVKHPDGWAVKKSHEERVIGVFDTQLQAEIRAKEIISSIGGGEVMVQGSNGRWRDSGK
jgi:Uncharacterized protein conserved in bacteria (DUF2188)